jgi:plastocyanin
VSVNGSFIRVMLALGLASAILRADGAPVLQLPGSASVDGKPEANVVVWLESPGTVPPRPQGRIVLDQRNLQFAPRVLAVRTGTIVEFPNNDRVFHNVFSFRDGKRFDLGLYPIGSVKHVQFDRPGVSRLFCNIHPRMAAYVVAVDSPFFAVSDEAGRFSLSEVPAGSYTYHAWHAGKSQASGTVSIERGSTLDIRWP